MATTKFDNVRGDPKADKADGRKNKNTPLSGGAKEDGGSQDAAQAAQAAIEGSAGAKEHDRDEARLDTVQPVGTPADLVTATDAERSEENTRKITIVDDRQLGTVQIGVNGKMLNYPRGKAIWVSDAVVGALESAGYKFVEA